ncbi:MAG: DUF1127 domain-containing protein [Pseudomonadota bacterium]
MERRGTIYAVLGAGGSWRALWAELRRQYVLARTRKALLMLNDDQLRDIGVTRDAARAEARKSFLTDT